MTEIALIGNSNVGKTTLYNNLTCSDEHTGNWAGVTVTGLTKQATNTDINIVDLPGIYSINLYSMEEKITYDYLLKNPNARVLNIVEANNLVRNLYLTLQLLELNCDLNLAINMIDELKSRGGSIDIKKLSDRLNVNVISLDARDKTQCFKTLNSIIGLKKRIPKLDYLNKIPLDKIISIIYKNTKQQNLDTKTIALRIFLKDLAAMDCLKLSDNQISQLNEILSAFKNPTETLVQLRYDYIKTILSDIYLPKYKTNNLLDKLFANKLLAIVFFALMFLSVFYVTFGKYGIGGICSWALDNIFVNIGKNLDSFLTSQNSPIWLKSFLTEAVIMALLNVIKFLPQIVLLFLFLAFLEDTGIMARITFLLDGLMSKIGLSGKSIFTLMMGLGCNSTAIMTSSNLNNSIIQKRTMLLVPFVSCSAKVPVFLTILVLSKSTLPNFLILFGLYFLGLVVGCIVGKIIYTLSKDKLTQDFILEIPLLRLPKLKRVFKVVKTNIFSFLSRVGSVIFIVMIVVWFLQSFDFKLNYIYTDISKSIFFNIGSIITPIFAPLGISDWRIAVSLLLGIVAKESVAGSLIMLFPNGLNILDNIGIMVLLIYILLYVPCIATISMIKKYGGTKTAVLSVAINLGVAYLLAISLNFAMRQSAISLIILSSVITIAISMFCVIKYIIKKNSRVTKGCGSCNAKFCRRKKL